MRGFLVFDYDEHTFKLDAEDVMTNERQCSVGRCSVMGLNRSSGLHILRTPVL